MLVLVAELAAAQLEQTEVKQQQLCQAQCLSGLVGSSFRACCGLSLLGTRAAVGGQLK